MKKNNNKDVTSLNRNVQRKGVRMERTNLREKILKDGIMVPLRMVPMLPHLEGKVRTNLRGRWVLTFGSSKSQRSYWNILNLRISTI